MSEGLILLNLDLAFLTRAPALSSERRHRLLARVMTAAPAAAPCCAPPFGEEEEKWTCDKWERASLTETTEEDRHSSCQQEEEQSNDEPRDGRNDRISQRARARERARALAWKHREAARRGAIYRGKKRKAPDKQSASRTIARSFRAHRRRVSNRRRGRAATAVQAIWRGLCDRKVARKLSVLQSTMREQEAARRRRQSRIKKFQRELEEMKKISAQDLSAMYKEEALKRTSARLERIKRDEEEALGVVTASGVRKSVQQPVFNAATPANELDDEELTNDNERFEARAIDALREAAASNRMVYSFRQPPRPDSFGEDTLLDTNDDSEDREARIERLRSRLEAQAPPVEEDGTVADFLEKLRSTYRLVAKFEKTQAEREKALEESKKFRQWALALADQMSDKDCWEKYEWPLPKRKKDREAAIRAVDSALKATSGNDEWYIARLPDEYGMGTAVDIREVQPLWPGEVPEPGKNYWNEDEASVWWYAWVRKRMKRYQQHNDEAQQLIDQGFEGLIDFARLSKEDRVRNANAWVAEQKGITELFRHQISTELWDEYREKAGITERDLKAKNGLALALKLQPLWRGYCQRAAIADERKETKILGAIDCLLNELSDAPAARRKQVIKQAIRRVSAGRQVHDNENAEDTDRRAPSQSALSCDSRRRDVHHQPKQRRRRGDYDVEEKKGTSPERPEAKISPPPLSVTSSSPYRSYRESSPTSSDFPVASIAVEAPVPTPPVAQKSVNSGRRRRPGPIAFVEDSGQARRKNNFSLDFSSIRDETKNATPTPPPPSQEKKWDE